MIHTKWFFGGGDVTDAHAIRRTVFIEEQNVPEELEMDGADAYAVHLVVYDGDAPVAAGRMIVDEEKLIIGRVAVLKEKRGQGCGGLLMRMLIRKAYDSGFTKQYIHAQLSARGFYQKLGFTACGEPFAEAGIPHIHMMHEGDILGCCI